jgi:hypothetical protein
MERGGNGSNQYRANSSNEPLKMVTQKQAADAAGISVATGQITSAHRQERVLLRRNRAGKKDVNFTPLHKTVAAVAKQAGKSG